MTVAVRAGRREDDGQVRGVVTAAFADDGRVADLVALLHRRADARVELVAEEAGSLVGHVMLSRCWLDAPQELVEVLVLSPLSVSPEHQQRGIGTALVAAALEAADAHGAPALFLEGDPAFYGPRGFVAGGGLGFGRPSARIPEPAFQVALLAGHRPWMTGRLVYCDAFWELDCVGLRPA